MHSYSWPPCRTGQLKWYFSPVLTTLSFCIGFVVVVYVVATSFMESDPSLLPIFLSAILLVMLTLWMVTSQEKAHHIHTISVLSSDEYFAYSFGIKNSALMVHYFLQTCKELRLQKNDISTIIKIVKCSHDHEDVSLKLLTI